ncbi:hydrophobin-2 [Agaricus bisporus var. bisporus H97]|uniref:hydrophobin-2 n=1 Tax=Agaricus bisporus var. bisporus (strain H97 / ATCC MYA-4626 / FGSC 10389) TaxID=936046 RepID=UPI00029F67EB|nr:hydrophobin-2 [Agaricus bisporus var. bisporus H97]EKV49800.1 hydrophobin-2 [Agaricus bisporus var. bisporus H97]
MFSRVLVAALVALPVLVSASPTPGGYPDSTTVVSQCNVGELHCCNTQQTPDHTNAAAGGLLGAAANVGALLGFDCTPISVIGIGGNNCAAQPVCCEANEFTGLINALSCSPINVNL